MMRKNVIVILFTCFFLGLSADVCGQAQLGFLVTPSANAVIYANDPASYSLKAQVINVGSSNIPAGDSIEVMVAVDGDYANATPWDGVYLSPGPVGPLVPHTINPHPHLRFNSQNAPTVYNGWGNAAANRFSGGGGVVHVITVWPAKVSGGTTPVTTVDTASMNVLYIDAAAFRVGHGNVSGLAGIVQFKSDYDIDIEAENDGLAANSAPVEYYAQMDNYGPVLLGTANTILAVNDTHLLDVPNFKLSSLYSHLQIDQNFANSQHQVVIFAQEQGLQNSIQVATYDVDASNAFPVELAGFGGKLVQDQIQLEWATVSEENNSHFFVEKFTLETATYERIAKVTGAGITASRQTYHLTDYYPTTGPNTYRLVQVDFDGNETYPGNVVEISYDINQTEAQVLTLYPNPVVDVANLRVRNPEPQETFIQVFDLTGKQIYSKEVSLAAGVVNIPINLGSQLLPGTYIYQIVLNDVPLSGKILKF